MVIIDAAVRQMPGVVGDEESLRDESFSWGILDYPHYTRPAQWRGRLVPEVLLSGHHREIERWRRSEAIRRTLARRPDLLESARLTDTDKKLIAEIRRNTTMDLIKVVEEGYKRSVPSFKWATL